MSASYTWSLFTHLKLLRRLDAHIIISVCTDWTHKRYDIPIHLYIDDWFSPCVVDFLNKHILLIGIVIYHLYILFEVHNLWKNNTIIFVQNYHIVKERQFCTVCVLSIVASVFVLLSQIYQSANCLVRLSSS